MASNHLNRSTVLAGIILLALLGCVTWPILAQSDTTPLEHTPPEPEATAQEQPQPLTVDSWLISAPDEIVATLSNGMQVAIKENHTNPVVAVRLYVATGSIHEASISGRD